MRLIFQCVCVFKSQTTKDPREVIILFPLSYYGLIWRFVRKQGNIS